MNPDRVHRLTEFGLTEYQARVYLALLDLGTATATQIPPHSGVPRTRIYATMAQLHERGLVEILPETPLRYKPVPFSAFLTKLAADHRERAARIDDDIPGLAKEFVVREGHDPIQRGRFEAIHGRRNARERLVKMYSAAKREIISIGTERSPGRIRKALAPYAEDIWKRGVQLKYAFPVTDANWADVEAMAKYADVRNIDFLMPVYLHAVDGREFMMSHPIPDDDSFYRGEDISIWSDDPAIAEALMQMAERMWAAGTKPTAENRGERALSRRLRSVD